MAALLGEATDGLARRQFFMACQRMEQIERIMERIFGSRQRMAHSRGLLSSVARESRNTIPGIEINEGTSA
jgi:hypothetical protein